ncbi:hypothetical protein D3C86_1932930 [compost metagenome]
MVQLRQRQARRVGKHARRFKLVQEKACEHALDLLAPVVEVSGHDQGGLRWNLALDETLQALDLPNAAPRNEPQVHHDHVDAAAMGVHLHMQQASLLETVV